jgi:CheY-like chemotaxis protein
MSGEHVLVIDDSPTILKVVQLVLTKAGYKVTTATDGDEGIEAAKRGRPDVILLDFVMPKMNGYQVCQALHQEDGLKDVPVILMSAKGDQVGERFVKVMGIVDYITKPFSPEAITGVVQHTIAKHREKSGEKEPPPLVPMVTPEEAKAAADAAALAKRAAVAALREGIAKVVAKAVVMGAIDKGVLSLEEGDVATFAKRALTDDALEILLGELRAAAPELAQQKDTALAGDLSAIPLAEVLLLLGQQEQQGVLVVTRGNAQVELYFRAGLVELGTARGVPEEFLLGFFVLADNMMTKEDFDAFLAGRGGEGEVHLLGAELVKQGKISDEDLKSVLKKQTCELVYEMLRWKHGKFSFRGMADLSPVARQASLALSVDGILMEGFRRVDEWHLIEREIDDFDLVLLRNEEAVARMGKGRLTREELAVLELVNGKNSVKDIVRQSRMGSFEVSKLLYRLLSIRLVRKRVQPVAV